MTTGQEDAAMIHLRRGCTLLVESRNGLPLDQRPAAGRTPVGNGLKTQHGVAVAAYAFHVFKIT